MTKISAGLLATLACIVSSDALAQERIGYIRIDDVVSLMPQSATLNAELQNYQKQVVEPRYVRLQQQYQSGDARIQDPNTPAAEREALKKKQADVALQLQNWSEDSQKMLEDKQNELLRPLYQQAIDAIKAVAKEKGYTHVLNKEALLVAPDGDDMITAVAGKLGLKLPAPAK